MKFLSIVYTGVHDSGIAIYDSEKASFELVIAEERLSRIKKDGRFPIRSLSLVDLKGVDVLCIPHREPDDQDTIAKSLQELSFHSFKRKPRPLEKPFFPLPDDYDRRFPPLDIPIEFVDHHTAHAASAFFWSGFDDALIVTYDSGARNCPYFAGVYAGKGMDLVPVYRYPIQHLIPACDPYTDMTAYLGFTPMKHEGKITGLAAYGKPNSRCRKVLLDIIQDFHTQSLGFCIWIFPFHDAVPPELIANASVVEAAKERLAPFPKEDIAWAIQDILEERVLKMIADASEHVDSRNICLAGGLFANVKVNLRIKEMGFERIFICPLMTDDGLGVGAALEAARRRGVLRPQKLPNMFMGPGFSSASLENELLEWGLTFHRTNNIAKSIADLLVQGKVVGRFTGRMEAGPRALGNRSILYHTQDVTVNDWLNKKLQRTEFMPFAPATLAEHTSECYIQPEGAEHTAEFMTICFRCTDQMKSQSPAVVHKDGTARPQLVTKESNPDLYAILRAYHKRTGIPSIINTSFNIHEEPIICTPEDSIRAFFDSQLDVLAIGNYLVYQEENLGVRQKYEQEKTTPLEALDLAGKSLEERVLSMQDSSCFEMWEQKRWLKGYRHAYRDLRQSFVAANRELASIKEYLAEAQKTCDHFRGLQQRNQSKLKSAKRYLTMVEKDRDNIKDELESTRLHLEEAEKGRDYFKNELEFTRINLGELEKARNYLKYEMESVQEYLAEVERARDSLKDELESSRLLLAKAEKARDYFKNELESTRLNFAKNKKARDYFKDELESTWLHLEEVEKARDHYKGKMEFTYGYLEEVEKARDYFKNELESAQLHLGEMEKGNERIRYFYQKERHARLHFQASYGHVLAEINAIYNARAYFFFRLAQRSSMPFRKLFRLIKKLKNKIAAWHMVLHEERVEPAEKTLIQSQTEISKLPLIFVWDTGGISAVAFDSLLQQTLAGCQILFVTSRSKEDLSEFDAAIKVVQPLKNELQAALRTFGADLAINIRNDIKLFPLTLQKLYMAKFYRQDLPVVAIVGLHEEAAWRDNIDFEEMVFASDKVQSFSPLAVSPEFIADLPDGPLSWEDLVLASEFQEVSVLPEISYITYHVYKLFPMTFRMIERQPFQQRINRPPLDFTAIAPHLPENETVLVVTAWLPLGGAEKHLYYVLKEFRAMGYQIVIVCTEIMDFRMGDQSFRFFKDITPYIYHLDHTLPIQYWQRFLESLICKINIRKIFIQGSRFMYQILPDLKSRFPELFVIDQLFNADFKLGHIAWNCKVHPYIDLTFGAVEEVKNELEKRFPSDSVFTIHSGVEVNEKFIGRYRAIEARRKLNLPMDRIIVSFIGRISSEKNPFTFLKIARSFGNEARDPYFLMVGHGPLLNDLQEEIYRRPPSNLRFYSFLEDLHDAYAATDVVINCSHTEALPLSLIESMAHGVALIVRNVGDQSLLVHPGENGFLCESADPEEYVMFLKKVMETNGFLENAKRISWLIVKDFSREKMIEKYRQVFEQCWSTSEGSSSELSH